MTTWGLESALVPVTGAASGIGLAICRALRATGARPVLLDMDRVGLEQALAELYPNETPAIGRWGFVVDVRESAAVDACFETIRQIHGPVTHAVANAGIAGGQPFTEVDDALWHRVVDVNLHGVMYTCRAAARQLVPQGKGAIVTMASIAGMLVKPHRAAYSASKAAVIHLTRSLAMDLGPQGIRVNSVAPGVTETPIQKLNSPEAINATAGRSALQRLGQPQEIASAVMFLLSEHASFITGQTLVADGGLSITYR